MEQNEKKNECAAEQNKKKSKKKRGITIFAVLGLLVTLVQGGLKIHDFYSNRELRHFFGDSAQYITDLSAEEQAELLQLYNVRIPESATDAYISAFGKAVQNGNYAVYFIEFDEVKSYQAFYDANTHRDPSINQTTNSDDDMYLVYAERVLPKEEGKQQYAELFDDYSEKRK